jgi:hypothetical protein
MSPLLGHRPLGHRPSPAMVVAMLALFISLAGTGYAAIKLPADSVGTNQLKANAVVSSKVKDRSLKATDFAAGQLSVGPQGATGAQGLAGAQGSAGTQGSAGPKGEAGATHVVMRVTGPNAAQAFCQFGEVAVGGGGISSDGFLTESQPTPFVSGGTPTGWQVDASHADGTAAFVTAWVVCAS